MIGKSTGIILKSGGVAFLIFTFLCIEYIERTFPDFSSSVLREISAVCHDRGTQWIVFLCFGIYFVSFLFFGSYATSAIFWRAANPNLWLVGVFLISTIRYAIDYLPSTQALILMGGMALGQGTALLVIFERKSEQLECRAGFEILVVFWLIFLLMLASSWNFNSSQPFEYHHYARWSGYWDTPNIAGLLMGTGVILAAGQIIRGLMPDAQSRTSEAGSWKFGMGVRLKWIFTALYLVAAILLGRGLLHSYSRGAWIAAICGLSHLIYHGVKSPTFKARNVSCVLGSAQFINWARRNSQILSVIGLSVIVLAFWQFRHLKHEVITSRVISALNVNDFSWRNRIVAWEGALQITAEHPWLGAGWNQPESFYNRYYLPPTVDEGAAIEMNDYLMLGALLGIPALVCFGMYIWFSLSPELGVEGLGQPKKLNGEPDWRQTTCRAGAIVLAVGFWFDGGLFKLATASVFWILLELGRRGFVASSLKSLA